MPINHELKKPANDHKPKSRRCLMCGDHFTSEGPHNRICKKCKSSANWREGATTTYAPN